MIRGTRSTRSTTQALALAGAVCALFAGNAQAQQQEKMAKEKEPSSMVRCAGVNACKGKSACAGAENACKGKNVCKGHGFTEEQSAKACEDKGGKVLASAKR